MSRDKTSAGSAELLLVALKFTAKLNGRETILARLDDRAEHPQRFFDALFQLFELCQDFILSGLDVSDCLIGRRERAGHGD
jgi:hypothetical protein